MAREVGVGVIGLGWMGVVHSRAYRAVADRFPEGGVRPVLVACADEVEDRARDAQKHFGFRRFTADWRTVTDDPDVDVVSVATPNHLHLEIVRSAAAAGGGAGGGRGGGGGGWGAGGGGAGRAGSGRGGRRRPAGPAS